MPLASRIVRLRSSLRCALQGRFSSASSVAVPARARRRCRYAEAGMSSRPHAVERARECWYRHEHQKQLAGSIAGGERASVNARRSHGREPTATIVEPRTPSRTEAPRRTRHDAGSGAARTWASNRLCRSPRKRRAAASTSMPAAAPKRASPTRSCRPSSKASSCTLGLATERYRASSSASCVPTSPAGSSPTASSAYAATPALVSDCRLFL